MRRATFTSLCVIGATALLLPRPSRAAPVDHSRDQVTLTVKAVCVAEAHYTISDEVKADDKVTVTLTERNVYRIVEWGSSGVELELVSGRREIDPIGGGSYTVAHVSELDKKWRYGKGPQPDSPESSVSIDPKGRASSVSLLNYAGGSSVRVEGEDRSAASALNVAELTLSSYMSDDPLRGRPSPMSQQLRFQFDPDQKQVQASGHGSHRFDLKGEQGAVMTGTLDVTFTVDLGHEPDRDEAEVSVEPAKVYGTWIPKGNVDEPKEPGSDPLEVTVTVYRKGDRKERREANLRISLPYVSKNRGVCGNWPRNAGEEEGLRFRQEDFPGRDGLLFKDRTHLETDVPVDEVTFRVHSYDYGAWGTLRVTATDTDGKALEVRVRGKGTPDLDIPLDEDSNRVADAWERGKAYGKSRADDDETVAGQDSEGDGLTLYDEYRGLLVLEKGQRVFRRLDPSRKEMFVIDPGGSFDPVTWEKTTLIKACKVDEELTEADSAGEDAPVVNHLSPTAPGQAAYAVRIETVDGDEDRNPATNAAGGLQPRTSQLPGNWVPGYSLQAGSVKSTEYCKVFPERARKLVTYVAEWVDTALTDPDSEAAGILRNEPLLGVTLAEARRAQELLRSGTVRESVARKVLTAVTIHEVGHCCGGLPDHQAAPPAGYEAAVRGCLMFNVADMGRLRMVIRTVLDRANDPLAFPYVRFCRDVPVAGYECFRTLNVKDW